MANERQEAFKPQKILFVELGLDGQGKDNYKKMMEEEFVSQSNFEAILSQILSSAEAPSSAKPPRFASMNGGVNREALPILCNGYETEVILYIPEEIGVFETSKAPISEYRESIMRNPRLFHLESDKLKTIDKFPASNGPKKSQLAAFSYRGETAMRTYRTKYAFGFKIEATTRSQPAYPGSGDIGHPGGSHP